MCVPCCFLYRRPSTLLTVITVTVLVATAPVLFTVGGYAGKALALYRQDPDDFFLHLVTRPEFWDRDDTWFQSGVLTLSAVLVATVGAFTLHMFLRWMGLTALRTAFYLALWLCCCCGACGRRSVWPKRTAR